MKTSKRRIVVLLLCTLGWITSAYGQITPTGDAYTNTADPTVNYGAKTLLDVDGASQITYIQFNLAAIPSGASISQATLKLYVNSVSTAGSFNVDYVNGTWAENTIDASNAPALGTTLASNVAVTSANKNQYILINITPAVQAWLNGSEANDGIALVANSTFNATFDSKENTTTSHPPELDVVFEAVQGVTTGSGSGLTGGGTGGTLNLSLTNACATNQVLQWNGTAWGCSGVGAGTVTSVGSGLGLTGGPITGSGTLAINTSVVPQLTTANTFTGNQTVNGNLSATGVVTGSGYQIGSNLFAFGSYAYQNALLGFAGNTTMTGSDNIAAGWQALYSNSTGSGNTASGIQALYSNTTGNNNTAAGDAALTWNTNGGANTASGAWALFNNTAGNNNTASGYRALVFNTTGGDNTASGVDALDNNTTGNGNVSAGYNALYWNTTGSYNTAVGYQAGNNNGLYETGSNNTFLGANTLVGATTNLNNATAIGANAEVLESNALVLGSINGVNGATASVNVGIGTTAPRSTLDVDATVASGLGPSVTLTNNGGNGQVSLDFNTTPPSSSGTYNPGARLEAVDDGNYSVSFYFQSNIPGAPNQGLQTNMVIQSKGPVGIGTLSPDALLSVNGSADKPGGGSWGTFSDRRLKNLDGSFNSGLSQIMKINPVRYRYKDDNGMGIRDHEEHVGVVAQEIQKAIPEAVTENSKGYLLVNNDPVIWAMLNAIKEQQQEINALRVQLRERATKEVLLESKLARLEQERKEPTRLAAVRPTP